MARPRSKPDDLAEATRRMYARVLSAWAMDLMALRRMGLDRPVSRSACADLATPSYPMPAGLRGHRWPVSHTGPLLSWKSQRRAA